MAYVEWLRVRNTLRGFAIALGILFAIVVIGHITSNFNPIQAQVSDEMKSPTAKISSENVDGAVKLTIVDPARNIRATVTDYGFGRRSYSVAPLKPGSTVTLSSKNSSVHISASGVTTDDIGQFDISAFAVMALVGGLIMACFLGGALSKENGQLAIAWTKPIDRNRLTLLTFGIDAIGIAIGMLLTVLVCTAGVELIVPIVPKASPDSLVLIGLCLTLPFAWYAFITAATTSFKRRIGGIIAGLYLGAFFLPELAAIQFGDSVFGSLVHFVLKSIAFFDPITYLNLMSDTAHSASFFASQSANIVVLIGLVILYGAASIVQWRRLEA